MRTAFGVDEVTDVSSAVRSWLVRAGHELVEVVEDRPWTEVGLSVGRAVAEGAAELGVVICWTGTGVSIAANKVPGVRAALCTDAATAAGARRWNDANVVAIGQRLTGVPVAEEILDAFFSTAADAETLVAIEGLEPR